MRKSLSETLYDGLLSLKWRYESSLLLHKSFSFLILFKFESGLYRFNMFLLGIKFSWKKTKKKKKDEANELFQEKRRASIVWIAFSIFLYNFLTSFK